MASLRSIGKALLALMCALPLCGHAQRSPVENTATGIFSPRVQTLTVAIEGDRLAPPIVTLNSTDRLEIGFDILAEERDYLRYSIYHCNADWSPSSLVDSEVFDGFNLADVENYEFSHATTTHYVHYTISLPNSDFRFTISGNYLLKVYPENDPDDTLLQVRFMVSEGMVNVGGQVRTQTDIDFNRTHQQVDFTIDTNRYPIRDIYNDLRVVVSQNGRADNAVVVTHPLRVAGDRAIFEHNPQLIFPAGNEYRRMETVQLTYPGMGVADVEYVHPYYHHMLNMARPRHSIPYSYDQTQHGRFFVREYNAANSDVEADYSVVHFELEMLPIPDMDVYIDGDLTHRRLDERARMDYDAERGVYHKVLLLKQGAYNYQYLALPTAARGRFRSDALRNYAPASASTAEIEGDFFETVNEYLILVYYRAPGERYDRLIGYTLINSNNGL